MTESILDAALDYAGRGWSIFPCKPDKSPYTEHGFHDATTDPEQIRGWWGRWPDAWIGCPCKINGWLVLDLDNKDGRNGSQDWHELVQTYGGGQGVEVGRTQGTMSGGYHLFFRHPDLDSIPKHPAGKDGIDSRSNAYVILTPSPGYRWADGFGPDNELTDPPDWLVDILRQGAQPEPTPALPQNNGKASNVQRVAHLDSDGAKWLDEAIAKAHIGNRNDCGFELAIQLRDDGLSIDQAKDIMRQYARAVPKARGNPYTPSMAEKSAMSAYSQPPREPAKSLSNVQRVIHLDPATSSRGVAATGEAVNGPPPPEPEGDFIIPAEVKSNEPIDPSDVIINPRIVIRDMSYAMQPLPPRDWTVVNLLAAGNVGLLSAWTGSGKTWIAYELAVCHALGVPWMGFDTVQGPALIVNEEMDEYDLYDRLAKCNRAHYGDEQTPVKSISFARLNLFGESTAVADAALLEAAIIETGARLVIVDALSDIMVGGDENQVKDTQPVFMRLSDIAKRQRCAILVIHHTGKSGTTRGSSAIPGACDIAILAKRSANEQYLTFETEKARIIGNTKWVARMIWTPDQFYTERFEKTPTPALSPKEQAIINYLEMCDNYQATTKEICDATGVSRYMVINFAKAGHIRVVSGGGHGVIATYGLKVTDE